MLIPGTDINFAEIYRDPYRSLCAAVIFTAIQDAVSDPRKVHKRQRIRAISRKIEAIEYLESDHFVSLSEAADIKISQKLLLEKLNMERRNKERWRKIKFLLKKGKKSPKWQ